MAKDGSFAIFYIDKNYDPYVAEDLFYIIRLPFMYIAQLRNKYVLHSASFLYKEKGLGCLPILQELENPHTRTFGKTFKCFF